MICFSQQRDGFRLNESTNDDDVNFIKTNAGKREPGGKGKGGMQSNWIKCGKAIALPFFFFCRFLSEKNQVR